MGISMGGLYKSKVFPCRICSLRVKSNSFLCVQCGKWIHNVCAEEKCVTSKLSRNVASSKCEENIGEAVEQEETLCDDVDTVRKFTYLGDRVSAGCEAAVTART